MTEPLARSIRYDRRQKWVVSAVITLHWAAALPWIVPALYDFRHVTDVYHYGTGLWQGWFMFMNPPHEARRLAVEVTYADGSRAPLDLPWLGHEGALRAWRLMRYNEFEDRLRSGLGIYMARPERVYEDVCRYALAHVAGPPGVAPRRVEIVDYTTPIPEPDPQRGWVDFVSLLRYPEHEDRQLVFGTDVPGAR